MNSKFPWIIDFFVTTSIFICYTNNKNFFTENEDEQQKIRTFFDPKEQIRKWYIMSTAIQII